MEGERLRVLHKQDLKDQHGAKRGKSGNESTRNSWLVGQHGGCVAHSRGRDHSAEYAAKCKNNIRALSELQVCVNIDFHRQVSVKLIKENVLLKGWMRSC